MWWDLWGGDKWINIVEGWVAHPGMALSCYLCCSFSLLLLSVFMWCLPPQDEVANRKYYLGVVWYAPHQKFILVLSRRWNLGIRPKGQWSALVSWCKLVLLSGGCYKVRLLWIFGHYAHTGSLSTSLPCDNTDRGPQKVPMTYFWTPHQNCEPDEPLCLKKHSTSNNFL